jgi:hypothetical protein
MHKNNVMKVWNQLHALLALVSAEVSDQLHMLTIFCLQYNLDRIGGTQSYFGYSGEEKIPNTPTGS